MVLLGQQWTLLITEKQNTNFNNMLAGMEGKPHYDVKPNNHAITSDPDLSPEMLGSPQLSLAPHLQWLLFEQLGKR